MSRREPFDEIRQVIQTLLRKMEAKGAVRHECAASAIGVNDPVIHQYLGV